MICWPYQKTITALPIEVYGVFRNFYGYFDVSFFLNAPVLPITNQHFLHVTDSGSSVEIPSTSALWAASRSRGLHATMPSLFKKCRSLFPGLFWLRDFMQIPSLFLFKQTQKVANELTIDQARLSTLSRWIVGITNEWIQLARWLSAIRCSRWFYGSLLS